MNPELDALWRQLDLLGATLDALRREDGAGPINYDWSRELHPAPATTFEQVANAARLAEVSIPPHKRDHGPIDQHELVIGRTDYRMGLTLTGSPGGLARENIRVVVDWYDGPEERSLIEAWRIQPLPAWLDDRIDRVYSDMGWDTKGPASLSRFVTEHHPELLSLAKGLTS